MRVVLPLPALLNVAVSPVPGGPPAVQLVAVDQVALVVPFHVALAANAEGAATSAVSRTIASNDVVAEKEKRGRDAVLITFII